MRIANTKAEHSHDVLGLNLVFMRVGTAKNLIRIVRC